MSWFERQTMQQSAQSVERDQARYMRAAKVPEALENLAGPYGVRRFLVRFARQGVRIRIQAVEAIGLQHGGGPPPTDPTGQRREGLAKALTRLHKNMSVGPRWDRGVIGYLRGRNGEANIMVLFDEDAEQVTLANLPPPPSHGHPLEDPSYVHLIAQHEHIMHQIHSRTTMLGGQWDVWDLDGHTLTLNYGAETRRHNCQVLGVQDNSRQRYLWQSEDALFPEAAFSERVFSCDWNAANELSLLAAARLEAEWLFVGALEDDRTLFAAVR